MLAFFAALCVFKYSFFGFFYRPYLDDYVQYILYPSIENPLKSVLFGGVGTAYTRPLAALFDIYFWSIFKNNLSSAAVMLSVLYAASGIVFFKALKNLGCTPSAVFLIFYGLLPTAAEGTLWISAGSRIVCGMLFTALSVFFISRNISRNMSVKRLMFKNRALFFVFNLFSLCFYEQIAVLSLSSVLLIYFLNIKDAKKYLPELFISLFNAFLITAYYFMFGKKGDNAERLALSLDAVKNFRGCLYSVSELALSKQLPLYTVGFLRGAAEIKLVRDFLWLLAMLFLCGGMAYFFEEKEKQSLRAWAGLFGIGLFLFCVPLLPFFVLENPWLNFRNLTPSLLGLAIMADACTRPVRGGGKTLVFAAAVYLIICNISEAGDYARTMLRDEKIIYGIAGDISASDEIYYYPKVQSYLPQSSPYHDHIMSVTGSDWGLTGTVRAVSGNTKITVVRTSKSVQP